MTDRWLHVFQGSHHTRRTGLSWTSLGVAQTAHMWPPDSSARLSPVFRTVPGPAVQVTVPPTRVFVLTSVRRSWSNELLHRDFLFHGWRLFAEYKYCCGGQMMVHETARRAARMGAIQCIEHNMIFNPNKNRQLERLRHRWEDNSKIDLE
jgi:hypothetical protein